MNQLDDPKALYERYMPKERKKQHKNRKKKHKPGNS